jgi:transposase
MAVIEGRERRIVGGVDTHKDLHVAAVVDERDRVIGAQSFATTRQGYRQMLAWMRSFGDLQRVGVESTGSYGAGLLRFMQQAGIAVLEVTTPDEQDRRRRGKNDDLDAQNAAHAAFAGQRTVTPRSRDGMIESLRVLMACRKTAVAARRVALQLIQNTIVCAPDGLRDQLRSMTRMQLIRTLAAWRPDLTAYRDVEAAYRIAFKSLARRYLELHDEIADLDAMIAAIVDELAPNLVARNSIGHTGAAQLLLTAGDNPERLRSEASFASLCGVSPVPASSGKTVRHRLNRGGDRAANSALHIIAIGRLRTDQRDQALRRSPTRRRAFQARRHSRPEALPRQRGLHAHHAAAKGNQRHANRRLTNRRASVVRNTPRSLSAIAARKPAFVHRQARSETPTTMRCVRVSSPPSNAS